MEKVLDKSTLVQSDKKKLEDALIKSVSALNAEEIAVIRARSSYLTSVEKEVFKSILEETKTSYDSMTKAELLEVCQDKGIEADPSLKKSDIIDLIVKSEEK